MWCNDGTITITASGGTAPLQYSIGGAYQASGSFTGLAAGTYNVTVRNANGTCAVTGPIEVLTAPTNATITNVASTNPTNCGVNDGTITITATNGGSLEYSINGGTSYQPSNVFSNLAAGTYNIRVRNINGSCMVTGNPVIITAPVAPIIDDVVASNPTGCGTNDGQISIAATFNPVPGIEFSIDGGINWSANNTFTNLPAGTYNVAIRNLNGTCMVMSVDNPIILTAPNAPAVTTVASTNPTDCNQTDGTITITAVGGTAPLQYSINGGATYVANGGNFTGLGGGTYQIRVRNANGSCVVTYPNVILVAPAAPSITAVASTNPTNCGVTDGTITITASGTGSLQYSINGGTTWQASDVFTGLAGGTYNITVRNINGTCITTATAEILTDPVQPTYTNVPVVGNPSNCGTNDGFITISASGAGALEYSIDGGLNWQPSNTFGSLGAGTYNVAIRNANGTCVTLSPTNPIILTAPNAPSITNVASTNPTDCGSTDGTITVSAVGGSGSLEYSINGGVSYQPTGTFTALAGGTYNIIVRNDDGSCSVIGQTVVLINKVAPTITNVAATNPTNCGVTDGTITITASGSGSLQYSINGGVNWSAAGLFVGLPGGTYNVLVRNIDQTCQVSATPVVLTAPVLPVINQVTFTNPTNCGLNNGSVTINATSTVSLEYSINGGLTWQPTGTFNGLSSGTYYAVVRNISGTCPVMYTSNPVVLVAPNAPSVTNVASTNPTNCNLNDGTITVTATGGTA
ncbi:MAG: hypothetical protein HC803_06980, partial [Saprospiraceae bacterium]|nr:hypothetical protein [Saprospiraceae bacterium]